jgi:hypothetical protein
MSRAMAKPKQLGDQGMMERENTGTGTLQAGVCVLGLLVVGCCLEVGFTSSP